MGLRCSLLGHEYDDVTVERDREERGNEVVITERELEVCARCGAERVVSENTEVRSLEADRNSAPGAGQAPDSASDAGERAPGADSGSTNPPGVGSEPSPGGQPPSSAPESTSPTEEIGPSRADESAAAQAGGPAEDVIEHVEDDQSEFEPPTDPADDDAVILGEESEDDEDREQGQWPDTDDHRQGEPSAAGAEDDGPQVADETATGPAPAAESGDDTGAPAAAGGTDDAAEEAATAWPEPEGEDEGFDAEPTESDFEFGGEHVDATDVDAAAQSASAAEEPAGGAAADTEFVEPGTGITSAGPFEETETDTIETVLVCPECGLERDAAGSSLRAGDICPECRRGYLAEQ